MMPPEPCIKHRCYSPTACNGWGYCRERNAEDANSAVTDAMLPERRRLAEDRRARAEP